MGDFEAFLVGKVESQVRYHSINLENLTLSRKPAKGQFLVGSLTGAVTS